ncbi:hypothetical protein Cgig2_022939 [Carnegiea gigantea]|uniref:Uncharacterized protein n=1 Tax=Carnegiea gigantea TaxID=171969 RepID=A0A9Q1KBW2_9CARY|nr:hypothetical protein Cgig2_022939 [Carnegiea gigantea]
MLNFENGVKCSKDGGSYKGKEGLSARKLAATLWEINGLHSPGSSAGLKEDNFGDRKERERARRSSEQHFLLDQQPHSPGFEKIDGSKVRGHRRRSSATSQKLQITELISGGLDTYRKASSIEVASHTAPGEYSSSVKTRLKDVNYSLIASKELVKVLLRILSQEEQHSSRITLVSALKVELDRARLQVDQLIQEQRFTCNQIDALLKHFAEEKAAWKSREKERIREAVSSMARELEIERKLRRQAERLNKKLGTELADTRGNFSRVMTELNGERRAREILEQTCDELARGIGEERVEVEELKKESEKVREEVEKERQMLQLADVLREERVQMKLAEARYEYEEKSAALERLKSELDMYLRNGGGRENVDGSPHFDGKIDFEDFLTKTQLGSLKDEEKEQSEGEVDDGEEDDSGDSELHSIELNTENNRSYKWNFPCDGTDQGESRRASTDEVFKGRKSLSEKIQWESICLHKKTSGGIERGFKQGNSHVNVFDKNRQSEACENGEINDNDDGFKRFKPAKSQRLPSCQESGSPAMSTGRSSSRLREACSAILQDLALRREQFEGQSLGNKR